MLLGPPAILVALAWAFAPRRVNETAPKEKLRASRAQTRKADARLKEYRALLEQGQSEVAALARIDYRMQTHVEKLEASPRVRDERIAVLQRQINTRSKSR